ncbi:phosphotransferase family protein [Paenibacillus piri]|uniref:Aminoglycoside phosphotransferase family protein n=1 Tax=Paenibacillus piri TaxID=2547395 RepID=A0A4R5KMZ4_9BACL|nr:aminoglycoside phosphotransferase family protein [Paenibacillus piri]TDF96278.1 aminoglycoside phosphotransferase family protein [Paenibacillus piri]
MNSVTKTIVAEAVIEQMVKDAFGHDAEIDSIEELTGGFFNTAYAIALRDRFKTVLKVAPSPNVRVLRCEKNIMGSEIESLKLIARSTTVPVPQVYVYSTKRNIIRSDYFFMEYMPGMPLDQLQSKLTAEQFHEVNRQIGAYAKQIHNITGQTFGAALSGSQRFASWSEAFIGCIDDLIQDGKEAAVELPIGWDELRSLFSAKRDMLDTVKTPRLVHRDLWWGNIFVDADTLEVTGITDCERSLFGDPLLDFVFGFVEQNEGFNRGYGRTQQAPSWSERCLLNLYGIYSILLIIMESRYRMLQGNEQDEDRARNELLEEIRKAKSLGDSPY